MFKTQVANLFPSYGRTIEIIVHIGTRTQAVNVPVAEQCATSVDLGCDFCDIHVQAIKAHLTIVDMDDCSTVRIVCQHSNSNTTVPITEEKCFTTRKNSNTPKIKTTTRVRLKPATNTWIEVTTKRE